MSRRPRSSNTAYFTALALAFMILVKVFVVDGIDAYRKPTAQTQSVAIHTEQPPQPRSEAHIGKAAKIPHFDFTAHIPQPEAFVPPDEPVKNVPAPPAAIPEKESRIPHEPAFTPDDSPKLAIIIDDMGLARGCTQDIIDLPAPLTLAFLPYAERLEEFTIPAKDKGHELIIHVPMEPMNSDLDLGPHGLRTGMDEENFKSVMQDYIFNVFDGYVGINNHMGSKLTQDKEAMGWVMEELSQRDLFFIDSKTIASSIAAKTAAQYNVPFAERDVFLDHYDTIESVRKALHQLELVAMDKGVGIAIGHPKAHTVKALQEWIPDAAARGFEFVPVSAVIHRPAVIKRNAASSSDRMKAEALKQLNLTPVSPEPSFSPYSDY